MEFIFEKDWTVIEVKVDNLLNKTWIGKKCKLVVEGLNKEQFFYTAFIKDISNGLMTIEDKFGEHITLNISRILQITETKGDKDVV